MMTLGIGNINTLKKLKIKRIKCVKERIGMEININKGNYIFTSESVTEGHPDKVCDQISDAVLDACLEQDKNSRVACECFAGKGFLVIGGEITTNVNINADKIARNVIRDIGYTDSNIGFDAENVAISVMLNSQSPDIAMGVDTGGAGDQGIMFGYACNETPELMPAPIQYAHNLTKQLSKVRRELYKDLIRPDGKSQVSVIYDENGKVAGIDTILISTQHSDAADIDTLTRIIKKHVISNAIPGELITDKTKILVNPTGRFVIGGPKGDTGLTGRKIIVDSYGGYARHGGGAWSGKDPTKVDRSASYMARYLAKNIVASGVVNRCEIQLAYAIGVAEPVSVYVTTDKSELDIKISEIIRSNIDLTPAGIIRALDLRNVKYTALAAYGHVGRDANIAPWERIDIDKIFMSI